jgi:hypothetical protein
VALSRLTKDVVGGSFTLDIRVAFGDGCDRSSYVGAIYTLMRRRVQFICCSPRRRSSRTSRQTIARFTFPRLTQHRVSVVSPASCESAPVRSSQGLGSPLHHSNPKWPGTAGTSWDVSRDGSNLKNPQCLRPLGRRDGSRPPRATLPLAGENQIRQREVGSRQLGAQLRNSFLISGHLPLAVPEPARGSMFPFQFSFRR